MKVLRFWLASFALAAASAAPGGDAALDRGEGLGTGSEDAQVEINAIYLEISKNALRDFKSQNRHWRCFRAIIYQADGAWHVDFVSNEKAKRDGDSIVVGATQCGDAVSYTVSASGKILRRTYSR